MGNESGGVYFGMSECQTEVLYTLDWVEEASLLAVGVSDPTIHVFHYLQVDEIASQTLKSWRKTLSRYGYFPKRCQPNTAAPARHNIVEV